MVEDQAVAVPVPGTYFLVKHLISPASARGRGQHEHHAVPIEAVINRRAVEVSCFIEGHTGGPVPALATYEPVQHALGPASVVVRSQLEDRAAAELTHTELRGASFEWRAVEISCWVKDQAGLRSDSVHAVLEGAEA